MRVHRGRPGLRLRQKYIGWPVCTNVGTGKCRNRKVQGQDKGGTRQRTSCCMGTITSAGGGDRDLWVTAEPNGSLHARFMT